MNFAALLGRSSGRATPSLRRTPKAHHSHQPNPAERHLSFVRTCSDKPSHLWPLDRYKYIDKDGVYTGSQSVHNPGREGYRYDVIHPRTKKAVKEPLMGYRFPEETMKKLLADKRILFGEDDSKIIELKVCNCSPPCQNHVAVRAFGL
jgi:hypothetical protein